jgi:hypothetical protein
MIYIIIASIIIIIIILAISGIRIEKANFNKGYCKICHQKLSCFDTDSQGGRGYTCPEMHYTTWISYPFIDKDFKEKN